MLSLLLLVGCESGPVTRARFEIDADTTQQAQFFALPYPSDLRLDADAHPMLSGWPNPENNPLIDGLVHSVASRKRWPVLAVGYFDFSAPLAVRNLEDPVAAGAGAPVLLVDLSDAPPARGRLTPVWLQSGQGDEYLPMTSLAIAARPGFVLTTGRKYAFVVRRSLGDASGRPLVPARAFETLADGHVPSGSHGQAARELYAPLWPVLEELGVDRGEVAAATVFTTDDAVLETQQLTDRALATQTVSITGLQLHPGDGDHARYCELAGKITFPQFQGGTPPFNTDGLLVVDASGTPVKQRDEVADVVVTLPKTPMPEAGYPLVLYFHGSGGDPYQIADAGPATSADEATEVKGQGPAHILSPEGFAMAASALPVAPGRVPGASDYAYVNLQNLAATRDIFRQGVIEQRLFLAALEKLQIPASALGSCTGATLPASATAYHFDVQKEFAQGQSMGGMYTNLFSAIEPHIKASVPTGAGGYWGYFILETSFVPHALDLLVAVFNLRVPTFVHPLLALFEAATEPSDPLVSTPRLELDPLPGSPVRSVYEPVGYNDKYFPTTVYDAMALGYAHTEAGDEVWPTMQPTLALDGRAGLVPYPIEHNRTSRDGTPFTGAIVQYAGDGVTDAHYIYRQLDAVKYQYRCFLASAAKGTPRIPAPAPLDMPCP